MEALGRRKGFAETEGPETSVLPLHLSLGALMEPLTLPLDKRRVVW